MNNVVNTIFLFGVKQREHIITLFKVLYIFLIILTLVAIYSILTRTGPARTFSGLAGDFGQWSIVVYILTTIPGIFRRFRLQNKLISLLMMYRRYLGLLMFFMVFYHYMLERGITLFRIGIQKFILGIGSYPTFELFGVTSFFILFLLAVTSNDVSTKQMGIWWGRVHALTYILLWCMFLHVSLQLNIWSLLLGLTGVIQVLSFIYKYVQTK